VVGFGNNSQIRDSLNLFESRVRVIYRLVCQHGVTHALLTSDGTPSTDSFLKACHNGFAKAQKLIIAELITVQETKKSLEEGLKSARKKKNKISINNTKKKIGVENFKEAVLRKLADSIAWHMIGGQNYIARRLCLREQSRPTLSSSNLSSVIQVVDSYNETNFLSFALVSDITNFIQVGDVLLASPDGLKIIEVKEGDKNLEAATVIAELNEHSTYEEQVDSLVTDNKLRDQIYRMLRQKNRAEQVTTLLNEEIGTDLSTNLSVEIIDPKYPSEKYYDELYALMEQLSPKKDWAYTVIGGCLHIGVYKGDWRACGPNLLRASAFEEFDEKYPVANLQDGLRQAFVEPLFVKPFSEDQIFDIAFGRISIFILLRIDHFIELFETTKASARMLPPKRSRREQSKHPKDKLLMHQGCCIEITNESGTWFLGDGIEFRIVYDNMTPRCIIGMNANAYHLDA